MNDKTKTRSIPVSVVQQDPPVPVGNEVALWDVAIDILNERSRTFVFGVCAEEQQFMDLVEGDMKARDEFGLQKYGCRLQANNGRDFLIDMYQESLDLFVYSLAHDDGEITNIALGLVIRLRGKIALRDNELDFS